MKIEDLTSRNHKSGSIEMPAPFETLPIDIMHKKSVWMLQSAKVEVSLGTLNTLDFPRSFSACQYLGLLCPLTILQYGLGIAHSYAPNVKPSSESQNHLF